MKKMISIMFTALLLSACGSISTTVSVLNPRVIENAKNTSIKESAFYAALNQDREYITEKLRPEREEINEISDRLGQAWILHASTQVQGSNRAKTAMAAGNSWKAQASMTKGQFNQSVNTSISQIAQKNVDIRTLLAKNENRETILDGSTPIPAEIRTKLTNRQVIIDTLDTNIKGHKRSLNFDLARVTTANQGAKAEDAKPSITGNVDSLVGGLNKRSDASFLSIEEKLRDEVKRVSIDTDIYAYHVANADKPNWEEKYNKVDAFGLFGNSDFIIIVDGSGNLRMKGISFDPSKVAQMASKVTTQSIIMAASMMGAPVPKGDSAQSNSHQLVNSSDALNTKREESRQLIIQENEYRQALLAIANAAIEKEPQLDEPKKYNDATKAFKASFEAHKSRIKSAD